MLNVSISRRLKLDKYLSRCLQIDKYLSGWPQRDKNYLIHIRCTVTREKDAFAKLDFRK